MDIQVSEELTALLGMDLGDLFAEADRIGNQYQTPEEIEAFQTKMREIISAI